MRWVGMSQRELEASWAKMTGEPALEPAGHLHGGISLPDTSLGTCFLMTVAGVQWEIFRTVPGRAHQRRKALRRDAPPPVGEVAAAGP